MFRLITDYFTTGWLPAVLQRHAAGDLPQDPRLEAVPRVSPRGAAVRGRRRHHPRPVRGRQEASEERGGIEGVQMVPRRGLGSHQEEASSHRGQDQVDRRYE